MDELLINAVDSAIAVAPIEVQGEQNMVTHVQSTNQWNSFRDTKASEMFADYQSRRGQMYDDNYIILLHIYMFACLNVAYINVFMFKCLHNVILAIVTFFCCRM